jgi:hypothetical protein
MTTTTRTTKTTNPFGGRIAEEEEAEEGVAIRRLR